METFIRNECYPFAMIHNDAVKEQNEFVELPIQLQHSMWDSAFKWRGNGCTRQAPMYNYSFHPIIPKAT